jgi:phosphoheptose isomerase
VVTEAFVSSPLAVRAHALRHALDALEQTAQQVNDIGARIASKLHLGGTVLTIGNGGAASLSQHFSAELTGRLSASRDRLPLAACSLAADSVTLTALANDYGFAAVFARQLAAIGTARDVLVMITTSGQSKNLIAADQVAKQSGMYRVAMLGGRPSPLDGCESVLRVAAEDPGTIQECQLLMLHALTEAVETAYAACLARRTTPDPAMRPGAAPGAAGER